MAQNDGFNLVDPDTGEVLNHKGRRLDKIGREIPDPTPLPPPPGYIDQPSIFDLVRQQVALHLKAQKEDAEEPESFEEADDFSDDEEDEYASPYEGDFDVDLQQLYADVEARKNRQDGEKSPAVDIPVTKTDVGTSDPLDKTLNPSNSQS